jgi:hypothetical protein
MTIDDPAECPKNPFQVKDRLVNLDIPDRKTSPAGFALCASEWSLLSGPRPRAQVTTL